MNSLAKKAMFLILIIIFATIVYYINNMYSNSFSTNEIIVVNNNKYTVKQIDGSDNNCMMRALADQYNMTHDKSVNHADIRKTIMNEIESRPTVYDVDARTVPISEMKKSGTQGDHMELQAAANYFKRKIYVYDKEKRKPLEIPPIKQKHNTPWVLVFEPIGSSSGHYSSLVRSD